MHPEKLDLRSHDIAEDKKQELLRLFPEIRTEGGKIDFARLQLALGEMIDVGKERYGMNWPGKADCFKTIQAPSLGTLLPCRAESVNFDATENLILEGDNLEVLKLLQKSYLGKVKMIYIDPPYNTGNDFIYPDNYTESLQTYLEYTGQVDAEGRKFSTNTEADGRFHSKWLNMMYPRLYLARNLLQEDGVIFISVDDNEVTNLRRLCDEIFGEENFLACITWQKVYSPRMDDTGISVEHDFLLVYAKTSDFIPNRMPFEQNQKQFSELDQQTGFNYRPRSLRKEGKGSLREDRPNLYFPLTAPDGSEVYPIKPDGTHGRWRMGKSKYEKLSAEGQIEWVKTKRGWQPIVKQFFDHTATRPYMTIWPHGEVGHNHAAADELRKLMNSPVFDNPKPSSLIKRAIEISMSTIDDDEDEAARSHDTDIILDFFAGSGTTAHAVLELNAQDHGNRKFILVQLPEPTGRKDFPTIADITKERVSRVIHKLAQNRKDAEKTPELDLGGSASLRETEPDLGFRVFKLAESNFKTWQANVEPGNTAALQNQLELHVDHIRQGRAEEDILYEILLKSGYSPTTPVETLTLAAKQVYSAQSGAFLICLARELTLELIRAMAERQPQRVVCLDEGFSGNDQLKTNAVLIFKSKGATFKTV